MHPPRATRQTCCSVPSLPILFLVSLFPAAGEKGSAYAFRAPGGKLDMSGVVPVLDVKVTYFRFFVLLRSGSC